MSNALGDVVLFKSVGRETKKYFKQIRKRALTDFILEEGVKKRKGKKKYAGNDG
jgi:hypothetical protein